MTDYSDQIKENKKGYSLTTDETSNENVDITSFVPEKKKKITVNLNNSDVNNYYRSSYFDETITVNNGSFDMYLYGHGSKNVNLGSTTGNKVGFMNSGKNTATAGNGGNSFYFSNINSKNTVKAGTGVDKYFITGGTNKITDKGGNNIYQIDKYYSNNTIISGTGNDIYTIKQGVNNITDKGGDNTFIFNGVHYYGKYITGSGSDTFDITVSSTDGNLKINSGAGIDKLYIHNDADISYVTKITADLGNDNDIVEVNHQGANKDVTFTNIKTGRGVDDVTIAAGIENIIDTGSDGDTITIDGGNNNYITSGDGKDTVTISAGINNKISTGNDSDTITVLGSAVTSTTTIKAGKGNDNIETNDGTNYIYGEGGKDDIKLKGGNNTVYGGKDTITVMNGVNTIFANADTITISGGKYVINTINGKNTIEVNGSNHSDNTINLSKGNNTVQISGDGSRAKINIAAGKNTLDVGGTSIVSIASTTKTAQTIEIKDSAFCGVTLGKGNDIIRNSSDTAETNTIKSGAGNDKFYISAGRKNIYGESGNDYFELSGGCGHVIYGGDGNDTINIKEGVDTTSYFNSINGGKGKDTINIEGGKSTINANEGNDIINLKKGGGNTINGDDGADTFNITGGSGNHLYGDEGNDIFNINGGFANWIYGEEGDDIYNLNTKLISDTALITDPVGNNKINVSKNYNGAAAINNFSGTLSFDKSYKLTNTSNVKTDGSLNTSNSSITVYSNFIKDTQTFATADIRLIKNVNDEISDKDFNDHTIGSDSTIEKFSFGGKNYTLNLDNLKQDLVAWFSTRDYADSTAVFTGGNEADINSLMAVYTKDTAGCFVKA